MDTSAAWDRIAPGYDRTNTPTQLWLGNKGLEHAGIRPGIEQALGALVRERAGDGEAAVLTNPINIGVGAAPGGARG